MIVWRLTGSNYASDLSGYGAAIVGSKWTSKGLPVIYTTTNPSLAILEFYVHLRDADYLIDRYFSLASIYIPDTTKKTVITPDELPVGWMQSASEETTQDLGSAWIQNEESLCLELPNALVPYDRTILINPIHPDFKYIQLLAIEPYSFGEKFIESKNIVDELYKTHKKTKSNHSFMKDVFICHASEDKKDIVNKIVHDFQENGVSVWLDKNEILWGDSIIEKVNEGLKNSKFVILVISKNFMKKSWPKREMNAALNIEATLGQKKVLGILVGDENERKDILSDLTLQNDKLFMIWDGNTEEMIFQLKQIL